MCAVTDLNFDMWILYTRFRVFYGENSNDAKIELFGNFYDIFGKKNQYYGWEIQLFGKNE